MYILVRGKQPPPHWWLYATINIKTTLDFHSVNGSGSINGIDNSFIFSNKSKFCPLLQAGLVPSIIEKIAITVNSRVEQLIIIVFMMIIYCPYKIEYTSFSVIYAVNQ